MMGLLQYLKDQITEPIIVPTSLTKKDLIEFCREWEQRREKTNISYFPITPEMNSIMLRMIEELPDGTYRIKTSRDDLDNSKS